MYFIGYHGTSEASALNILSVGIQARFLPPTGQIGPGFYVAKTNGTLPQWGADWATERARSQQSFFVRMVSRITGEVNNPLATDGRAAGEVEALGGSSGRWRLRATPQLAFKRMPLLMPTKGGHAATRAVCEPEGFRLQAAAGGGDR